MQSTLKLTGIYLYSTVTTHSTLYTHRPLHLSAALVDVPEITHLLLDHNAEIDARNSSQSTPLFAACKANNPGIASALIEGGQLPSS